MSNNKYICKEEDYEMLFNMQPFYNHIVNTEMQLSIDNLKELFKQYKEDELRQNNSTSRTR